MKILILKIFIIFISKVDEYFYPSLNKIRFFNTSCDLKLEKLTLNDFTINCNKTSKYLSEEDNNIYLCFFDESQSNNLDYGNIIIKLNNIEIGHIFSSNSIKKTKFETSLNNNRFSISNPNEDFYMESIEPILYYKIWDLFGIISYNQANLTLSNNILVTEINNQPGFNISAIKIRRKLYEFENEDNAKEYEYYFNEKESQIYNNFLPPVYFEPDYILVGNTYYPIPEEKRTTNLIVPEGINIYDFSHNGCRAINCFNFINDKPIFSLDTKPGNIITGIRGETSPGKLKVIRFEFQNERQELFGEFKLQDIILDFYIPIDENKTISVKYNNKYINENKKALNLNKKRFENKLMSMTETDMNYYLLNSNELRKRNDKMKQKFAAPGFQKLKEKKVQESITSIDFEE